VRSLLLPGFQDPYKSVLLHLSLFANLASDLGDLLAASMMMMMMSSQHVSYFWQPACRCAVLALSEKVSGLMQ
jgi:hypothetical protein